MNVQDRVKSLQDRLQQLYNTYSAKGERIPRGTFMRLAHAYNMTDKQIQHYWGVCRHQSKIQNPPTMLAKTNHLPPAKRRRADATRYDDMHVM